MKKNLYIAATLSVVLLLAGCAGMMLQSPSVTLAGMEVLEATLFEQRFAFKLRVQNPNAMEIPITGLSFSVELNNQPFAKGVSDKPVTVPPLGEAVLEVTAVSGLGGILRQIKELRHPNRDSVSYRIKGRLMTGSFGSLDFDENGRL
ncbi:MAG: LEA type 2 family protein [Proteobacteria bacterium]|nr:LEA type 2 family protein [Pseudomonadota bacterium]MBU2261442.1 LEA type 2 family protein [Pseudomonadota bacterium]